MPQAHSMPGARGEGGRRTRLQRNGREPRHPGIDSHRNRGYSYRQGVEPFQHEGEDFDPRRQRSVSTVPTDDPERNKTIAGRLRPGFQAGEKLIRPEIVSVHILKK